MRFVIPDEFNGRRLDVVLAQLLPQYSRSRLQQWIDQGYVRIADQPAIAKKKVDSGESVEIHPQSNPAETPYEPENIALDIYFEDEHLLVINKPVGLVVHPGHGNWQGTMLNALLAHCPSLAEVPRAGIIHRLDKETSGLLVVAKNIPMQTKLVRMLQGREIKRVYWAVAFGKVVSDGVIDQPIGRDPRERTRMAVIEQGKPSRTHYRIVERFAQATLLECALETGRTHQIRVHLAFMKHPLLGDPIYGKLQISLSKKLNFHRQALHARQLGLPHPVTGEWMQWLSPLPHDFEILLQTLREKNVNLASS